MESGRAGPGPGRYTNRQRKGRHRHAQRQSHHPQTHTGVACDHTGGGRRLTASLPRHSDAFTLPCAVGDKEASHLTHVHNSKCTCGHACPRTHMSTHMVSHTWRLPNGQARPGTAPAVAHPSHAVTRWAELHTGPESQVCSVSPARAHTYKHNSTLLRSLINTPGTARHTQAFRHTQTIGLQAGRHTCGAFPHRCTPRNCGIIYLTPNQENTFHTCSKSHKDRHPQVLEFSGKGREGQARATKSHAQVHGHKVLV